MEKSKVLALLCRTLLLRSVELGREAGLSYSVLAEGDGVAAAVFPHLTYHVDLPCWLETAYLLIYGVNQMQIRVAFLGLN